MFVGGKYGAALWEPLARLSASHWVFVKLGVAGRSTVSTLGLISTLGIRFSKNTQGVDPVRVDETLEKELSRFCHDSDVSSRVVYSPSLGSNNNTRSKLHLSLNKCENSEQFSRVGLNSSPGETGPSSILKQSHSMTAYRGLNKPGKVTFVNNNNNYSDVCLGNFPSLPGYYRS